MDEARFDRLARGIAGRTTRRAVVALLVGGLLLPVTAATRAKDRHRPRKNRSTRQGKNKSGERHAAAQTEPCWRAAACLPSKGSNVSRCDLSGSTALQGLDCTGCNLSRANLSGVNAQGAKFAKANLSGACLVNADFTGATFANTTNLFNAIFCNTRMPDGSLNNSGCASGTACCGTCPAGQTYCNGECINTQTDPANCGTCDNDCTGGNACNTAVCNQGACGTTPNTGAPCNGGLGTCNASGQCIATVCAGKATASPCFPFDAGTCNNGGSTCRCGTDIHGNVACYENAFCNGGPQQCASNADCVAMGFAAGSICFRAKDICCVSETGCTTPCPT